MMKVCCNNYFTKNTDISKAKRTVGYAPTHDIYQGMEEAIEWYIESIGQN